jgi:hypothetical protein
MCPTVIGRIHTRVASIVLGPVLIGLIFTLVSGHLDWIVLVGVYLMLGIFLDTAIYPWLLKWQPPWVAFLLALAEFGLLLVLAGILNRKTGGLHNISIPEAIGFYWLCWVAAALVKIVVLPIANLTYAESAAEFRRPAWSIPPPLEPLPVLASSEEAKAGPGPVIREASGVHAKPLEPLPSPSGVHRLPPQPA